MSIRLKLFVGFIFLNGLSFGQVPPNTHNINTSGAEEYLKIASNLRAGHEINAYEWHSLFETPVYKMMIEGKAIDATILISEMNRVFHPLNSRSEATFSAREQYHQDYKDHQQQLEKYLNLLNKIDVEDSIKILLYPFLPSRLRFQNLFPKIYYLNYGAPEATGFGGMVLNDLLLSYRIDSFKFGLLAAHEAFHAVVSVAFQAALKQNIEYDAADFNLLTFLEIVSEEGVADLIDKPLLTHKSSPLYSELKMLSESNGLHPKRFILSLDSLLKISLTNEEHLQPYNNFSMLINTFSKNGGHIPGKYMGVVIAEAGLLPRHIEQVENPISFFLTYNEAAKKLGKEYPVFSEESVVYLQNLGIKYLQ